MSRVVLYIHVARGETRKGMRDTKISSMANIEPSSMEGSSLAILALVMMGTTPPRTLTMVESCTHRELLNIILYY